MIFCYSGKFARDNPERIETIRDLVNDIEARLNESNLNCSVSFVEVASGPPSFLLDLAENSPEDKFVLYTGEDDIPKYRMLFNKKYVPNENIEIAGYQRFEGGVSGTEVRKIFDTDDPSPEEKERLQQALPDFVNPKSVYDFYRSKEKPVVAPEKTKDYKEPKEVLSKIESNIHIVSIDSDYYFTLDRDIYAMKKVLKMLQEGFFTWIGELGSGKY